MKTPATILAVLAPLSAMAGTTSPTLDPVASASAEESQWAFKANLYGWAQSLDGDIGIRRLSIPVDIGFDDIIENLDISVMGAFEARHGKWGFMADVVYAELSVDSTLFAGRVPFELTQEQLLANFIASYSLIDCDPVKFAVYAGTRINSIDVEINSPRPRLNRSWDDSWADPIVGARFQWEMTDQFFFRAVGDIGGFGVSSDITWQAMAGFGYRISENGSLLLGYRSIGTDYTDGGFTYDVTASGPIIGFEYKF
ncbi:MAG: hypothetical protein MUF13_04465 [Akkermansiaceae bacterium]|nr:hypothetical protein [Akkermansiaceae bacterium]